MEREPDLAAVPAEPTVVCPACYISAEAGCVWCGGPRVTKVEDADHFRAMQRARNVAPDAESGEQW